MREINEIIVHCSATKEGQPYSVEQMDRDHRSRGWNGIGYHYVIHADGTIERGRPESLPGAHCKGRNSTSIGICYIGGLDRHGKEKDTRTEAQRQAMRELIRRLILQYPSIKRVMGHRDASPDLNGNGVVDPWERVKACPCFDAIQEFATLLEIWNRAA